MLVPSSLHLSAWKRRDFSLRNLAKRPKSAAESAPAADAFAPPSSTPERPDAIAHLARETAAGRPWHEALLEAVGPAPVPADALLRSRAQEAALGRLVARGLVRIAASVVGMARTS